MFQLGYLGLEEKAKVETLHWQLCREIWKLIPQAESVPDELKDLDRLLEDQFLVNFSVFQSLPDSWAIGHVFPIMPIHRLTEKPERNAAP